MNATATIKRNVSVRLPYTELTGDVQLSQHEGGNLALVLLSDEGAEVLTVHAEAPRALKPDEVLIRDYSEHIGLALALQDAGVVEITGSFKIPPFSCRVCIARVLKPSPLTPEQLTPEVIAFLQQMKARIDTVLADPEWEWDAMIEATRDVHDSISSALR